jgi:hypothetical protein
MDAGNAPNAAGRADGQDCSPEPVWSKNSSEAAREITPQRPHCVAGAGGLEPPNGGVKIRLIIKGEQNQT